MTPSGTLVPQHLHLQFLEWLKERGLVPPNGGFLTSQAQKLTNFQLQHRQDISESAGRHKSTILHSHRSTPKMTNRPEAVRSPLQFPNKPPPCPPAMRITLLPKMFQGMNCAQKVGVVCNYFRPFLPNIDILCFQEHKLRGDKLLTLNHAIWPLARYFC